MPATNGLAKRSEKGLLTPDNCVVAFIDHQPQMLFGASYPDRESIINHTVALAKATRVFRCARRSYNGRNAELQWKYLAAAPRGVPEARSDRAVVHECLGRPELRGRDQGDRSKKDRLGALDRSMRRLPDGAGDPRRL
jgi:hypothetical protein